MNTRVVKTAIIMELGLAEARVLLDELEEVPGGTRLPKLRQVCKELRTALSMRAVAVAARRAEEETKEGQEE